MPGTLSKTNLARTSKSRRSFSLKRMLKQMSFILTKTANSLVQIPVKFRLFLFGSSLCIIESSPSKSPSTELPTKYRLILWISAIDKLLFRLFETKICCWMASTSFPPSCSPRLIQASLTDSNSFWALRACRRDWASELSFTKSFSYFFLILSL